MLSYLQARAIAESQLQQHHLPDDQLVIVDDAIIEKPYAWIFPYTSNKFLQTGDHKYALGGNSPLFIDKLDGRMSEFRTGLSIDGMIDEYEEQNKVWRLTITTSIQHDAHQLSKLKHLLHLSLAELAELKAKTPLTVTRGSHRRLTTLAALLKADNIDTRIELVIQIH